MDLVSKFVETDYHLAMTTIGSSFYCHSCADHLGLLGGLHAVSSNPSAYQVEKAEKHTRPLSLSTGVHSVLLSGSTSEYEHLERVTVGAGFLELEPSGVRTLTYQTTGTIGVLYRGGSEYALADSFRRVLSTDPGRAHGYAVPSSDCMRFRCNSCSVALTS